MLVNSTTGQLRHTDTSLSVKADANYKMASIGSHKVTIFGIVNKCRHSQRGRWFEGLCDDNICALLLKLLNV